MSASPTFPGSKRDSRTSLTQLPLPSAVNPPAPKSNSPVAGPSSPTSPTRATSRYPQSSPSRATFNPPAPSSTHASGILPSASFFRPSRPNHQPQHYRPTSIDSEDGLPQAHDGDLFQMSSLSKQISRSSDGHDIPGNLDAVLDEDQFSSKKGTTKSREPLLPIARRTSLSARPSISRERSGASNASKGAKAMVRNSLDRVFNLSRGLSVDSLHRPTQQNMRQRTSVDDGSIEEVHTYESKFHDEEAGIYDSRRQSFARRKDSSSPNYPRGLEIANGTASPHSPSPDPSFIPIPPSANENLSAIPRKHPETSRTVRNHQTHPSNNTFFLQGRLLTGGDSPWAFIGALTVLFGITGVYFGTTAVWWWNNESPAVAAVAAYMALLTITTMFTAALSDPGILPRDLDLNPPYPANSPSDGNPRAPMPRDLKVRADVVRVKYCHTCLTYRPPRSSHCKMCDNCVDGCDHHCQWVNNCIGHRNYTTFFVLLLSATLTLLLIIVTSALHLYLMTVKDGIDFKQALSKGIGSAVAFCLSVVIIWPVGALLTYHMRLLFLNITTIEQIRNQAHQSLVPGPAPPNPFSHGSWSKNLMAVLCRPAGYSWLQPHAIATEDKREVNPGLLDE